MSYKSISDVLAKHDIENDIEMNRIKNFDRYYLNNQPKVTHLSKKEFNTLKYSTILQMAGDYGFIAKRILTEWEGSFTSTLIRNIVEEHYADIDIMELLRKRIIPLENRTDILIDALKMIKSYKAENLFHDQSLIYENVFLSQVADEKLIDFLIEHDDLINDILLCYDFMTDKLFKLMYSALIKHPTPQYTFTAKCFYEYISNEDILKITDINVFSRVLYGKVIYTDPILVIDMLNEIESKFKFNCCTFESILDGFKASYALNRYSCYKTLGIKNAKDVTAELLLECSANDLALVRLTYTSQFGKVINSPEYLNHSKIKPSNLFNYLIKVEPEVLVNYLTRFDDILLNDINVGRILNICNDSIMLYGIVIKYPIDDIIIWLNYSLNRDYLTELELSLLDYVLTQDKDNYNKLDFSNFLI